MGFRYLIMANHNTDMGISRVNLGAIIKPVITKYGIEDGDFMRVTSRRGSVVGRAKITEKVKPGLIYMTFHFAETPVNQLTSAHYFLLKTK